MNAIGMRLRNNLCMVMVSQNRWYFSQVYKMYKRKMIFSKKTGISKPAEIRKNICYVLKMMIS